MILTPEQSQGILPQSKKEILGKGIAPLLPQYSYTKSLFEQDKNLLQVSHMTKPERFPKIFDAAKKLKPAAKRILSFGCSTGEECQALARRFPNAEIVGVDIDIYSIKEARRNNKSENVFFSDELGPLGKFDIITCLMVLFCMEVPITKDRWAKTLNKLNNHINPNGVIMIYTSEFDPAEVLTEDNYKALNTWTHIHNRNAKPYFDGYYRKRRKWW